jgi:hypothetical protein
MYMNPRREPKQFPVVANVCGTETMRLINQFQFMILKKDA